MQKSTGSDYEKSDLCDFVNEYRVCADNTSCHRCGNPGTVYRDDGRCGGSAGESGEEQCVERLGGCWGNFGGRRRGHRGRGGQRRGFLAVALIWLLAACGGQPSAWHLDSIATGDRQFDSGKLVYAVPSSHLKLEFLRTETGISGFLYLQQHRFKDVPQTEALVTINGEQTKHALPVRSGRMRLALPPELTQTLLSALHIGHEAVILIDGFELTVSPARFEEKYAGLSGGTLDLLNFVTGSIR
jgi:hypothetical protein